MTTSTQRDLEHRIDVAVTALRAALEDGSCLPRPDVLAVIDLLDHP